jgi:fructose-bisphosphate aldolase, class I
MEETITKLLNPVKGILAADESTHTMEKRMATINVSSTPEINRNYRQMLFSTPGIEKYISGIIMFDETVRQKTDEDVSFCDFLTQKGIVPGIKVDEGLEPFNGGEEEITKGIEGLSERLKEYSSFGLKFTKWRGAFVISDLYPSDPFLEENLNRMVEFAKISQANGFVPIVEPEVLLKGNHTTTRCEEITTKVLRLLFAKLNNQNVDLTKLLLKTNMVLPGKDSTVKAEPLEVAGATLRTLKNSVPAEVPGIVFLSGGQTPDEATLNLNEIVKLKKDAPWQLSFSFSRALQGEALQTWSGKDENMKAAQEVFLKRAELVSRARQGGLE